VAATELLDVDAPVGLLGQQGPREAVQHETDPDEEHARDEHGPHDERVDAELARDAPAHAADPTVRGADDAGPAHGGEEGVLGGRRGARTRRWVRCLAHDSSELPRGRTGPSGTTLNEP